MLDEKKKLKKNRIFYSMIILYLYYYSYRYIFKYNTSLTSQTYQNTPFYLMIAKYIILMIIIFRLILNTKSDIRYKKNDVSIIALIFLVAQFLINGCIAKSVDSIAFALTIIPIFFYISNFCPDISKVEKIFEVFWWYSTIYEIFQIALYFLYGRLPALAWNTGNFSDVRFGGAWDSPNEFALLLFFYIYYFLFKYKGIKRIFYLCVTGLMFLLCWSGTAFIALALTFVLIGIIRFNDKKIKNFYTLLFSLFLIIVPIILMEHSKISQAISFFVTRKQGSMNGHFSSWDLSDLNILNWIGILPKEKKCEVGYIRILRIAGIPGLFFFSTIILDCLIKILKIIKIYKKLNDSNISLMYGFLSYTIGFMLYQFNHEPIYSFSNIGFLSCIVIIINNLNSTCCIDRDISVTH